MPRPFAVIGITFFMTLLILSYLNESAAIIILVIAGVCLIPVLCIKSFREQGVLPSAFLAVMAGCIMFLAGNEYKYKPAIALAGDKVNINGNIIDLPSKENGRFYYIIKTNTIDRKNIKIKIRLSCAKPLQAEPYDTINTEATIYILGNNNEDSLQYYKTTGVFLGAYSYSDITVISTQNKPLMYQILSIKQALLKNINELLPNENGGLVIALLLGNKSYLSENNLENFRNIGISHIIAISGLNLSIFLLIFLDIFERLKLNKRFVYFLSLLFVMIVMALAGFSASVLRAGIMLIILILGKLINKEADALNSIGLSLFIICVFNPLGAGYVGLQLSFFATLGIVTFQKKIAKPLDNIADRISDNIIRKIFKFINETLSVTVVSFIFTLPTIFITFKKVALISILSNLLLVYSSTISMVFGGISALTMRFKSLDFISNPAAIIAGIFAKYILKCSDLLAKISFSNINVSNTYLQIWLAGALLIIAVSVIIFIRNNKSYFKLSLILCAATLMIGYTSFYYFNRDITQITVASVENASAAIVSKGKRAVLIGCGGNDFSAGNIFYALDKNNLKTLDLLLIPRTANTESQSVANIIARYKIKRIIVPELDYDLDFLSYYNNIKVSKNEKISLWNDAKLDYIYSEDSSCAYADIEGLKVLFIFYPGCNVSHIPQYWKNADILICREQPPLNLNCLKFGTVVISGDEEIGMREAEIIVAKGGNAICTEKNRNIVIRVNANRAYSVKGDN